MSGFPPPPATSPQPENTPAGATPGSGPGLASQQAHYPAEQAAQRLAEQQQAHSPAEQQANPPAHAPELDAEDHRLRGVLEAVRGEVAKVVVGQDDTVTGLLLALLCRGHVLLEGVPGVAKTLLIRTLSHALDLDATRVQFTPDLMPGDVTGSLVYNSKTGEFEFRPGPVFTNLLIADEINRTPPKTQSALLEAMEERQVSVDGTPRSLPEPFLVAATQNPVEYEGTYPLPEAQLDRFLFKLLMNAPEKATEYEILSRHARGFDAHHLAATGISPVADIPTLTAASERTRRVHVAPEVLAYIVDIVHATRQAPSLSLGVSPRGATRLLAAAQARAWLAGRGFVTPDDVKALIPMTFRHRVSLRPEAQMEGITVEHVLSSIVSTAEVPR